MSALTDGLLTVDIHGLACGGAGVGRIGGKAVFVPGAYPGDTVLVRVEKDKKRHAEASLVRVETPSPDRAPPACPSAADCGGCPWMGLSYPVQLEWKRKIVEDTLRRIGGMETSAAPTAPSPAQTGYRARVKMKVKVDEAGALTGYHRPRSHDLAAVGACPVANETVNAVMKETRRFLNMAGEAASGIFEMEIFSDFGGSKGVVELRSKNRKPEGFMKRLMESAPSLKGAVWRAGETVSAAGDTTLFTPTIEGKNLIFWPGVFTQVNPEQNIALTQTVARLAALGAGMSGLDLYCGMGNLTLPLAMSGAAMTGIESNAEAVRAAWENRERLKILTAAFSEAGAQGTMRKMVKNGLSFDTVIADPPRGGMAGLCGEAAALAKGRIVYVSCDPPALARDAAQLGRLGFSLREARPVDMFPQTSHIEVAALFERIS